MLVKGEDLERNKAGLDPEAKSFNVITNLHNIIFRGAVELVL